MYKEIHVGDEVTCQYKHVGEIGYRPHFKVKVLKISDTFTGRAYLCEDEKMHFICKACEIKNESQSDLFCINGFLYGPGINGSQGVDKETVSKLLGFK